MVTGPLVVVVGAAVVVVEAVVDVEEDVDVDEDVVAGAEAATTMSPPSRPAATTSTAIKVAPTAIDAQTRGVRPLTFTATPRL